MRVRESRGWARLPRTLLLAGCLALVATVLLESGRLAAAERRIIELQTVGGKTRVTVNTWLERITFGLYRRGRAVSSDDLDELMRVRADAGRNVSRASLGLAAAGALFLVPRRPVDRRALLQRMLLLAGAFLIPGLFAPMLSIRSFLELPVFGEVVLQAETRSILGSVGFLLAHGNAPLGLVILLFSVVLPIAKLLLIQLALLAGGAVTRPTEALKALGRWSMLDVFVAAVTVVFFAFTSYRGTDARVGVGLYFFAGCGLLSLAATQLFSSLEPASGGSADRPFPAPPSRG